MKKFILLIYLLALTFTYSYSQKLSENITIGKFKPNYKIKILIPDSISNPFKKPVLNLRQTKGITMTEISSSGNAYTLLFPESRCLSADQNSGEIMFTHRGNPLAGIGKSNNNIIQSISADNGSTWKDIVVTGDTTIPNRYPSGVIYNSSGSSSNGNLYSIFCGPTLYQDSSLNYFGSAKLDSSNIQTQYVSQKKYNQMFPINGLTICDDSMAHVLGERIDTDAAGQLVHLTLIINNGKFNSQTNTFDWKQVEINHPLLKNTKGEIYAADVENTAWSQDGKVGYIYLLGIDSAKSQQSYQPIIYKSLDKGATWNLLPVYNFKNLTALTQYLPGTTKDTTLKIPWFYRESVNAIVDGKNNLHIFSNVFGSSSANINDSLDAPYGYNLIFDVYTTSDSTWNADLINILLTQEVLPEDKVFYSASTSLGWDHRLQISKSEDGEKLFFVWSDSDPQYAQLSTDGIHYINNVPNLFAYGKDVITGKKTEIYNITGGSSIDGLAFWHYVSEQTLKIFNNYIVPVSISPILDIYTTNPDDPITHYYLPGVQFSEDMFVVNPVVIEYKTPIAADVSQNYPNPMSSSSTIVVNLSQPSELSLEINDMLGQKVYEESLGKVPASAHTFTISKNDLPPGIYFYTVRADLNVVTKKMIIE